MVNYEQIKNCIKQKHNYSVKACCIDHVKEVHNLPSKKIITDFVKKNELGMFKSKTSGYHKNK